MTSASQINNSNNKEKVITWKELQKHNRHDDSWIVSDGIVYDVTQWAKTHPGGDIILLGGGTDATIMIHSYHANGIKPELMKKFQIGIIEQGKDKSYYDDFTSDKFYNTLRQRVCDYFVQNKISRRGEGIPIMYVKTLFILFNFFFGLYHMTVNGSYLGALWMGTFAAEIGINIMHDGSHGAFSKIPYLNTIACWTMDMIGASSYVWESQHVGGHHLWTNLENQKEINVESDPDVFSSYPLMRMHPSSERKWFHAYQHIYGPVLFMTFTMAKVFYNDFACFFYNQVMNISMNQRLSSKFNLIRITVWKIFSMIYMLILPMYFNGAGKGFLLFTLAHFMCGIILAFMFIVTHISEGANFLEQGKDIVQLQIQNKYLEQSKKQYNITKTQKASEHSWAAMQCRTSVNWSLGSVFWSNFSGGLNHQIEHHLFPGICHMHYPQIKNIVEKTCAEFEVPYVSYPTIWEAIQGMIGVLKQLGNPPKKQKTN